MGVTVTATCSACVPDSLQTITLADGSYAMNGLAPGMWSIKTEKNADYVQTLYTVGGLATNVSVGESVEVIGIDITVGRAGNIVGNVISSAGGPIAHIEVAVGCYTYVYGCYYETFTDSNGNFEVNGLVPGSYRVYFRDYTDLHSSFYYLNAEQHADATPVVIASGNTLSLANVVMQREPAIAGRITDIAGNALDSTTGRAEAYLCQTVDDDACVRVKAVDERMEMETTCFMG